MEKFKIKLREDDEARAVKEEILDLYCIWNENTKKYELKNWCYYGFINWSNCDYISRNPVLKKCFEYKHASGLYGTPCYLVSLDFPLNSLKYIRDTLRELSQYPLLDEEGYDCYFQNSCNEIFSDWVEEFENETWFDISYARENAEFIDDGEGVCFFSNKKKLIEDMKNSFKRKI